MSDPARVEVESPVANRRLTAAGALLGCGWLGLYFALFTWWELGLSVGFPLPWTTMFLGVLVVQAWLPRSKCPSGAGPLGLRMWLWFGVVLVAWALGQLDLWTGSNAVTQDLPLWLGLADFVLPLVVISEGLKGCVFSRRKWLAPVAVLALVVPMLWFVAVRMPGTTFAGARVELSAAEVATADRLQRDVEHLATTIGARGATDLDGLMEARDFLRTRLDAMGLVAQIDAFDAAGETYWNVEVEFSGDGSTDEVVLVGAHYDVCGSRPGADDNGTGVAALLEIARLAKEAQLKRTLKLVFFANEEPPFFGTELMGSRVRARAMTESGENVVAMFSLESIGYYRDDAGSQEYPFPLGYFYPDQGDFIAFVGNPISSSLVRDSVRAFRETTNFPSQGSVLPSFVPGVFWSDHASFWEEGTAAVMVTDTAPFRNPNYHRGTDTPETLDFLGMARVVGGIWEAIKSCDS